MSSSKRRLSDDDEEGEGEGEGEEGVDFPPASSSSSSAGRKRARQHSSLPASTPPPIPSDIDDEPEPKDAGAVEDPQDSDEDMEQDDDEDASEDERMREDAKRLKKPTKNGKTAQAGVIESVTLHNFMCHAFVEVHFGPQINFLVGNNGSGKSAVLTGISMALGGNAKASNRAGKSGGLVKDGAPTAVCSVKIRNRGPDAYHPEVYGPSIVVERRINKDMGGGYKIKDSTGKRTIDTTKGTLDKILDHFNIQVDNPMTVLTQDMSRQFLANSSAKDKYNFFLRGTQLAQLTEDYEAIRVKTEESEAILEKKKEVIPELKEAYKRAKVRCEEAEAAITQRDRVVQLKNELTWSYVVEVEDKINEVKNTIEKEESVYPKIEAELAKNTAVIGTADHEIAVLQEAQADAKGVSDGNEAERAQLTTDIQAIKEEIKAVNNEERRANNSLRVLQERVDQFDNEIQAEQARLERDANKERGSMRERVSELQADQINVAAAVHKANTEVADIEDEERESKDEYRSIKEKIDGAQRSIEDFTQRINHLEKSKSNTALMYHAKMPHLMELIRKERGWINPPVGPIGSFVKLKDMKFARSLESIMGQTLNGFAVENEQDRALLSRLERASGVFVPIITTRKDDTFDCSSGEPAPGILTIRRVLEIETPYIEQVLITSIHIEKAALVVHRAEGDALMRAHPHNVETCFSADGFRLSSSNGGSSTQGLDAWKGNNRLNPDMSAQIASLRQEQTGAVQHLQGFEAQKMELDGRLRDYYRKKNEASARSKAATKKVQQINKEIDRIQEELAAEEPSNLAALEEAKRDAEGERDALASQSQVFTDQKNALSARNNPLVHRRNEVEDLIKRNSKMIQKTSEQLEVHMKARGQATANILHFQKKMETQQVKIAAFEEDKKRLEDLADERIEQAKEICDRPVFEKKKSIHKLTQEIEMIEKALRDRERKQGATLEQIQTEVLVRRETAENAISLTNELAVLIANLHQAYAVRVERWMDFRTHIAARAKLQFLHHLANRGYTGKLSFDHEKLRLQLRVQPNDDEKGGTKSKGKDAKSLSGGEKSFSTICLLLTMWEAVGCPIRCLDEFDVFMDAVNRRVSMKLIIDTAKELGDTQFVLITPQAMGTVQWGPEVRVHKMRDPGRSQGTLAMDA